MIDGAWAADGEQSGPGSGHGIVGFVGLGAIGLPMAMRLLQWPGGLWVYDLVDEQVSRMRDAGARVATDLRQMAAIADVVCVMVRDDAQVNDVVGQLLKAARRSQTIVIHSTVSPATAVRLGELAAPHGVNVVDAPVSGGARGAADGRLAIMLGGRAEGVAAASPVLELMGDLVVSCGEVGSGTRMKIARNLIHFVAFSAAGEARKLAEGHGLDVGILGEVVRHTDAITGGPGAIIRGTDSGDEGLNELRSISLEHAASLGEKDLKLAIDLGGEVGISMPLALLALDALRPAIGLPKLGERNE